jgi:glyoxylase-like metal-dependent hydrolase (beta-lactamase superfamily II)
MITVLSAAILLAGCSRESADTAATSTMPAPAATVSAVAEAIAAMGMENLASLTYSGEAWRIRNSFRQTLTASPPWPSRDTITNYQRTIDLNQGASRATGDTFASNLFLEPPVAGVYTQNIAPDQSAWTQQLEIWLTPWGFLKGAELYGAEESQQMLDGATVTAVTWHSPATQVSPSGLQYTVTGYINEQNLVERVETWVEDAFMGDMHVVGVYSDYRDFGGVMVPATMEQQRGGGGIFGVTVAAATANPANAAELLTIPPPAAGGPGAGGGAPPAAAAPTELAQQLSEGVYLITGGYVALAVEFADHIAVFEAGQSETRGQQILDEVKRVFPNKPIRYLINSHPHSDHTAGMVPFVRDGATIITQANNVDFLNMALSTPRTLLGEATLTPQFEAAGDVMVLEDDTRRMELHHIMNDHTDGMLVAYLPAERILFQADFTLPQPGATANPFVVKLAEYVDANGLDFDQYLAVHAAAVPQTRADLLATIGK